MPLLGKKPFVSSSPPEGIKKDEEVFVIEGTQEVFRSYKEYIDRVLLYSSQIWTCQYTGKSQLNFEDAMESEQKALKLVKQFPKCFKESVLRHAHHWTSGLDGLVDKCFIDINSQFSENDSVSITIGETVKSARIDKVHFEEMDIPPSPTSDKENVDDQPKPPPKLYDVICDDGEVLKNIKPEKISPATKCPSRQLIALFIRANLSHPVTKSGDSVYVIKKEILEKYQIMDKIKDLPVNKKNGSAEPLSTIQNENHSKPKKTPKTDKTKKSMPEKHQTDSKTKNKKIDPLQRSLDCFRVQQPNVAIKKCTVSSPVKVKDIEINKEDSNAKKCSIVDLKSDGNQNTTEEDSCKIKKKNTEKSTKDNKKSSKSPKREKNTSNTESILTESKVSAKVTPKSGKKVSEKSQKQFKNSPKLNKKHNNSVTPSKEANAVVELERCPDISPVKVKHVGDKVTIESLSSDGMSNNYEIKANNLSSKNENSATKASKKTNAFSLLKSSSSSMSLKNLSEKKTKKEKSGKVDNRKVGKDNKESNGIIESADEKHKQEESKEKMKSEKKKKISSEKKSTKKPKHQKQDTVDSSPAIEIIDDSQDKPDVEMVVCTSPVKDDKGIQCHGTLKLEGTATNKKEKKQKTLSEMFNAALQRDKPNALSRVISKAIEQNISPLAVPLDINTPARNKIKERYEQIKWKYLSAEEKQKLKDERKRMKETMRNEKKRQEQLKRLEEKKKIEDTDLDLKPLPEGKTVVLPDELTIESFSDVLMVVEFIINYKDLLVPDEKLNLTTESLIQALMSGENGFPVLSRVLFILLNILHQNLRGKKKWTHILNGSKLTDMPLSEHTAPELARVYLEKMMNCYDSQFRNQNDNEMLSGIIQDMENQDYFLLTPQQKLKVLVALCHSLMSSDAIDNFIEARYEEYLGLRRQKLKEEQEIRSKKKEEKQKEKNQKIEKEKNEQEKKMSTENNPEATNTAVKTSEESKSQQNSILDVLLKEEKTSGEKNEDNPVKDEPSELAKAVKNRRLQVELKKQEIEKKEQEQRERRLKEEEEFRREQVIQEHEDSVTKFKASLRMVPLGYDRYHRRYWLFNGISGLFVEDGWMSFTSWRPETPPPDDEDEDDDNTEKEVISVSEDGAANNVKDDGTSEVITIDDSAKDKKVIDKEKEENGSEDVVIVKETEINRKEDINKDVLVDKSLRDVPYTWYYYDNMEDVKALMEGFTSRGMRESVLLQVLEGEKSNIEKNFKAKRIVEDTSNDLQKEDVLFTHMRESILDLADRITRGNLGEIDKIDKYAKDVESSKKLSPYIIKLQQSIFPRFLQGCLTEEKNIDKWTECVQDATTLSQLHLLLEILDTAVLWDKSAEGARCKICRKKGNEDDVLLLCDECNLGFHLYCLRPALTKIPKGEWKCMSCRPVSTARSARCSKVLDESYDSDEESDDDDDDESVENEDYCHSCQEGGDELICCDTCPLVFHKECHDPPLRYTPRGAWSCMDCKQPKKVKTRQQSGRANKMSSKATKKPAKRRNSDDSSTASSTKRSTRKRQLEDEDEEETRKRQRVSRKRQIEEESEEGSEESDEEESDGNESSNEEDDDNDSGESDSSEEEEDSGLEEEEPVVNRRSSRNVRPQKQALKTNSKTANQREKRKAPSKPDAKPAAKPAPTKRRRTNPELEVCETILIEMLRCEDSWPFLEPVNTKDVPDYLDLVSEPMDFKTIKERLEFLEYSEAEPFVRDMRLVFENCDKYNHISTQEGQAGDRLSKEFENLLKEHFPQFAAKTKKRSTRRSK